MATREQIYEAIRRADAAGDAESVRALGAYLQAQGGAQAPASTPTTSAPPARAPEGAGAVGDDGYYANANPFAKGADEAGRRALYGVKQLFTKLSPEEQAEIARMEQAQASDPSALRTAGGIWGNVLMSAVPGGAVSNGLRGAMSARGLTTAFPRLSTLLNTMGTSGALGFAMNPGKGEDREAQLADKGAQALQDASIVAPVMHGAGRVLGRTLQAFQPSVDAAMLMAQRVYPTLQQGAESVVGRFIGGLTPQSGRVAERQAGELANAASRRIVGHDNYADQPLNQRSAAMDQDIHSTLGDATQGQRVQITPQLLAGMDAIAQTAQTRTGQFAAEGAAAQKFLQNLMGQPGSVTHAEFQRQFLNPLTQKIAATTDPQVRKALQNAYNHLVGYRNGGLHPDEVGITNAIEDSQLDLHAFDRAKDAGATARTGISPGQLAGAHDVPQPRNYSGTKQDLADPAVRTINGGGPGGGTSLLAAAKRALATLSSLGGAGLAVGNPVAGLSLAAPLYGLSAAGQTKTGARLLFGDMDWQRAGRAAVDAAYPYAGAPSGYTAQPMLNYLENQ
jgi:hypothetical protein